MPDSHLPAPAITNAGLRAAETALALAAAELTSRVERNCPELVQDYAANEDVVMAYHRFRVAVERFDRLSRKRVDRCAGVFDSDAPEPLPER